MINAISEMLVGSGIEISLEFLLKGHQQLSEEENTKVFREVQLFISDSNRFSYWRLSCNSLFSVIHSLSLLTIANISMLLKC